MILEWSIDDDGRMVLRKNQDHPYMIRNRDKKSGDKKEYFRQFDPGGSEQ